MTLDRSVSQKEPLDGSPVSLGESLVLPRRVSAVGRSIIDPVRAGERGFASPTYTGAAIGERPNELLRLAAPVIEPLALIVWLVVLKADDRPSGTLISLRPYLWTRGEVTIGREAADIKFDNQALSKSHLEIRLDDAGQTCIVRDLGSTNGSFLATDPYAPFTQLVAAQPLRDGNALRLGDILLVFRCFRGAAGA